jgi:DNA-binding LytR/AlgR family response regulator
MKAFLVDDEPIAVDRLRVLIQEHGGVEVVGAGTAPAEVLPAIRESAPDVLFLDIEMPRLSGFELLAQLGSPQPLVVFTTAYEQYALDAFRVNSIDYLLKPIERAELARAIAKLEVCCTAVKRPEIWSPC